MFAQQTKYLLSFPDKFPTLLKWHSHHGEPAGSERSPRRDSNALRRMMALQSVKGWWRSAVTLSMRPVHPSVVPLRPHIPAIYAAIPDARVGVTNMVLIHENQLFTEMPCKPTVHSNQLFTEMQTKCPCKPTV